MFLTSWHKFKSVTDLPAESSDFWKGGKFTVKDVNVEQVEIPNEYGSWVVKFSIEESPAVDDGEGVQVEGDVKPSVEFVLCSPAVRQVALCISDAIVRAMVISLLVPLRYSMVRLRISLPSTCLSTLGCSM